MDEFNIWHDTIKLQLGLPKESVDNNGNIIKNGIVTNNYVEPFVVTENDVRASVEDLFSSNLEISTSPFVELEDITTGSVTI
jgi:hypothetical protein